MAAACRPGDPEIFVYAIHAPALADRQATLRELQGCLGACCVTVVSAAPLDPAAAAHLEVAAAAAEEEAERQPPFAGLRRQLHPREVSNALNPRAALLLIAGSGRPDALHVVVEDDVLFVPEALRLALGCVARAARAIPAAQRPDVLMLGMPTRGQGTPDAPHFEPADLHFPVLPCCDSYAVTPSAAHALADGFLPLRFAANVQLSYIMKTRGLRAAAVNPVLFLDGSKTGAFVSSLDRLGGLPWSRQHQAIRTLLAAAAAQGSALSPELDEAEALLAEEPLRAHPSFRHLAALARLQRGDVAGALREFEAAHTTLTAHGALVRCENRILRDYIAAHAHL